MKELGDYACTISPVKQGNAIRSWEGTKGFNDTRA